jgi:ribose/xylose/arabinose/galactoside ABC-type transport system permease subunit
LLELTVFVADLRILAMGQTIGMLAGTFDPIRGSVTTFINAVGAGMLGEAGQDLLRVLVFLWAMRAFIAFVKGIGITKLKILAYMMTLGLWLVRIACI